MIPSRMPLISTADLYVRCDNQELAPMLGLHGHVVAMNTHALLRWATEILADVGAEGNSWTRSTFVTVGALLSIKPVWRHAEHVVALNADAMNHAGAARQSSIFRGMRRRRRMLTHDPSLTQYSGALRRPARRA